MADELHTAGARSSGVRLGPAKRVLLVAASLALAYGIALATFMIRWMHFWIRGPYFFPYLTVFLAALALLLLWWTSRHHNRPLPVLSTVGYSVVAGYVAGLIAMGLHPVFQSGGVHHMLDALRFPTLEAAVAFFWFPVRLTTWLFGAITGGIMVVLSRRWRRMRL
jgi:hypothetical protein